MKAITTLYFIASIFVLPCTLNLENGWCCLIVMVNLIVSFLAFRHYNPEYIIK